MDVLANLMFVKITSAPLPSNMNFYPRITHENSYSSTIPEPENMKPAVDKLNSGIKITQENCISKELLVANHHRMNDYQPL